MLDSFKKERILFVFSDPGGAKPILSFIELQNPEFYTVISDRVYPFYSDFDIQVQSYSGNAMKQILAFGPTVIFTGTSYTSSIEKEFLTAAVNQGIKTISFVDHWTNILNRFKNKDGIQILPDEIWLIDKRAMNLAIEEGVKKEKIKVIGNPYHTWIKQWKPSVTRSNFLSKTGIEACKKVMVFAPDPISNVDGILQYGFDEFTITNDLCKLKLENPEVFSGWMVIVKSHPNQNREKLKNIVRYVPDFIFAEESIDTNLCLYYSDLVLGCFSSILIEAMVMSKKVIRYIPTAAKQDPMKDASVGKLINCIQDLKNELIK